MTDLEKIERCGDWPLWPVLPMKRIRDGNLETGCITADFQTIILNHFPNNKGILLQIGMESTEEELNELGVFRPQFSDEHRKMYEEQIVARYDDVPAMLADGWRVD